MRILLILSITLSFAHLSYAGNELHTAITQPIPISQIIAYTNYPPAVQELLAKALYLSQMKLTYLYGSSDPKNKGMDCSGTIYYLLNQSKLHKVPRQSDELFTWAQEKGKLYRVHGYDLNSTEFSQLKAGDLLFWSGTYVVHRKTSITHVMLYLGKNKKGEPLMFGASNGRTYQGNRMWGVSVFDFKLPRKKDFQRFEGYGCIPNLTCK